MAYNFFPKSEQEILTSLKSWPEANRNDVVSLFNYLSKHDTPINIDTAKKGMVNVSRALQGDYTIANIKREAGLKNINIKFGNGSSGNRGANNRGNAFETEFCTAIENWWTGDAQVTNANMLSAIQDLDKTYGLKKLKTFDAVAVGGENTRRPLKFGSQIQLTNTKGTGFNVGKSVTDVTLTNGAGKDLVYLSLKLGTTVTFFNVGVKTILTKAEIDSGNITNNNGLALLKLFGIDPVRFCSIFSNNIESNPGKVSVTPPAGPIQHLLQSGIGYGYHIIHKFPGRILSKKMDEAAMKTAARVGPVTIYYGGKGGTGKRIDMVMESSTYTFKLNIRDTQGGDGYPTRMMCDFSYK